MTAADIAAAAAMRYLPVTQPISSPAGGEAMFAGVTVVDVLGVKREHDGIIFVPAFLDFDDRAAVATVDVFDAATRADPRYRAAERACGVTDDLHSFPSVWLRSRVMAEFRVRPPVPGDDGGLLQVPFLAAVRGRAGRLDVHPFVCDAGEWGEPHLEFSPSCTPPEPRSVVVAAFRSLLLRDSRSLAPFQGVGLWGDEEDGGWAYVGIGDDGSAFEYGDDMDPDESDYPFCEWVDNMPGRVGRECEACGGEGEENFFPAGEPCELCGGTGRVNWRPAWPQDLKRPRRSTCRIFNRRS